MAKKKQVTSGAVSMPAHIMFAASKLKPAPYNPRKIGKREMRALRASIEEHGMVGSLVVQKKTRMVIGGHKRLEALKEICREHGEELPMIPVVMLDIDDRQAKKLNLALNKIGGSFDDELLRNLMVELRDEKALTEEELLPTGFTQKEIDRLLGGPTVDDGDDLKPFASSITLQLRFDSVEARDLVKSKLADMGNERNCKSGTIVKELLKL